LARSRQRGDAHRPPDGGKSAIGSTGGGPNGLARGPDGALYVCNNGGNEYAHGGFLSTGPSEDYQGGYIQADRSAHRGQRVLYSQCGGHKLSAPNDIVFDRHGGFYFTDLGSAGHATATMAALLCAADGSKIVELVHPMLSPNGVGLSRTRKPSMSQTPKARGSSLRHRRTRRRPQGAVPLALRRAPHMRAGRFSAVDSLAVEASGNIAVATLISGHITVIAPRGGRAAGQDAGCLPDQHLLWRSDMKTAYITLSVSVSSLRWIGPSRACASISRSDTPMKAAVLHARTSR